MDQPWGQAVTLAPGLQRIVAPNPGPMTGHGTNTYLVGKHELAVIDPGPAEPSHIEAILKAGHDSDGRNRIRWVIATHTHPDHSPAAAAIIKATGAECLGMSPPAGDNHQDLTFQPTRELRDGERLPGEGFSLLAIHTPGHVANHVCLLHEETGTLMTGDHIMQGSTVVIIPPAGDMKDYIESLKKLRRFPIKALAPGHGELIHQPMAEVDKLIEHRLWREQKILSVLQQGHSGTLEHLTPIAYDDVDASLHVIAQFSLWAHLIKLEKDGVVRKEGEGWSFG